jgi:hypothetical protein
LEVPQFLYQQLVMLELFRRRHYRQHFQIDRHHSQ